MDRVRYLLGILTLVVMIAGGWFLYRQLAAADMTESFELQVTFLDARGLKPGADVKFRGVRVGSVRAVDLDEEGARAVVEIGIAPGKSGLLRNNSRFWIVTPRFHGLAAGVSGLDTLVRDAYVAFSTPQPLGEPLAPGSGLRGEEAPLTPRNDVTLPPLGRGDLLLRVLLPENHAVTVGARVMFRGMPTGEVRSIELAPNGTYVEAVARVAGLYRSTVTDASVFWIAKPELDVRLSLTNPVTVHELGALLRPYIAYYTPPQTGVPVPDNHPVAALMGRPAIEITPVPPQALAKKPEMAPEVPDGPLTLVRVVYEATDVDYLTPNDTLHREATGLLYADGKGRTLILTARSSCDAGYYYRETFGMKATIRDERIAAQLPGSQVLKATRIWVQPSGLDLVVLEVQGLPRKYPTTKRALLDFRAKDTIPVEELQIRAAGELGVAEPPAKLELDPVTLDAMRGGVLFHGEKAVAILGQTGEADAKPDIVSLIALPDSLRPVE